MPNIQRIDSFRYRRSPRELMRIGVSLPLLPQRLMVNGETRSSSATSLTVSKSGRLVRSRSFFLLLVTVSEKLLSIMI